MPRAKRDWDLSKRSKVLPKFFSFFFIQKYPKWHFWIDFEGVFPPRLGASRWNKNQFILAAPVFRWGRTMAGEGVDQDPPTLCQTLRGSAQSFGCRCRPRTHAHTHWLVEVHIVRMERGKRMGQKCDGWECQMLSRHSDHRWTTNYYNFSHNYCFCDAAWDAGN